MKRLELKVDVHDLNTDDFLPAPNQGIIAVVGMPDSSFILATAKINHSETMEIYNVERHIVSSLNLGCSMPVGMLCTKTDIGFNVKCRFYSNFIREFKEFRLSFSNLEAVEELINNIKNKVPASYGYSFREGR